MFEFIPINSRRIRNGYAFIKTENGWQPEHRLIIEKEFLRIPSTKNLCFISRYRTNTNKKPVEQFITEMLSGLNFVLRKSDREKTIEYLSKKKEKILKRDHVNNYKNGNN